MPQIEKVIKQIKSEFRVDSEGKVTVSLRGAARLAGIEQSSLSRAFQPQMLAGELVMDLQEAKGAVESFFEEGRQAS